MAAAHGSDSAIKVNDGTSLRDITPYVKSVDFNRSRDANDVTTKGMNGKTYRAGLSDGDVRITGLWDDTALVGPRIAFKTLLTLPDPKAIEWYPEGTASGAEKSSSNALLTQYDESSPIDDMVAFTATLKISGDVTDGTAA